MKCANENGFSIIRLLQDDVYKNMGDLDKVAIYSGHRPEFAAKQKELALWEKVKEQTSSSRRVGVGFTALGDALAALGLPYNMSSADVIEKIAHTKMKGELDATIDMAKRMKREIVAKGVESEQQREYLLERKCEYLQGYLFSKPLPAKRIDSLLSERVKLMRVG